MADLTRGARPAVLAAALGAGMAAWAVREEGRQQHCPAGTPGRLDLGILGTCLAVAAEEDCCHLERKKGLLYNERGWERARSFGIVSVLLQSGAMPVSPTLCSVLLTAGHVEKSFLCHKHHICILQKGDKEGPAVTNAGVLQTARNPLQLFFFLPWFWKVFRFKSL